MYYKENEKVNEVEYKGEYYVKVRMYIPGSGYFIHWHRCYATTGNHAIKNTRKYIVDVVTNNLAGDDKVLQRLCSTLSKVLKREGRFFVQNWEYKVLYPDKKGYE